MFCRLLLLCSIFSLPLHGEGFEKDIFVQTNDIDSLVKQVLGNYAVGDKKNFIRDMQFLVIDHAPFQKEIVDNNGNKAALKLTFIRKPESIIGKQSEIEKSLPRFFNADYPEFFHIQKDIKFKENTIVITLSESVSTIERDMRNIVEFGKI